MLLKPPSLLLSASLSLYTLSVLSQAPGLREALLPWQREEYLNQPRREKKYSVRNEKKKKTCLQGDIYSVADELIYSLAQGFRSKC